MSLSQLKPTQIRALLVLLVLLPFIPTVLMLRLMLGAVENEREASRERMVDIYQRSLATVSSYLPNHLNAVAIDRDDTPAEQFQQIIDEHSLDGALIYDARHRLVFPSIAADSGAKPQADDDFTAREREAESLSRSVAARRPGNVDQAFLAGWEPVPGFPGLYAVRTRTQGYTIVLLRETKRLGLALQTFYSQTFDPLVSIRIRTDSGEFYPRAETPIGQPIVQAPVGDILPGWEAQLFLAKPKAMAEESGGQEQLKSYAWIAGTAIVADLFIAGMAAFAVNQQLKINDLRNSTLATVSHELKTPIAAARVLIDTILQGRCQHPAQAREYIELISGENYRLGRLVENFLTASRIDSSAYAFKPVDTEPAEILDSALEAMAPRLKERNCQLDLNVASDLPPVSVERDAMVIVLVNLLENAIKYSGESKQIGLGAHAQGDFVVFEVSDNGIGIARTQQRKIFQRFYRVDQKLTRREEGTGLGLSIVKQIVEAHGGSVGVRSRRGEGSVFSVRLPSVVTANA